MIQEQNLQTAPEQSDTHEEGSLDAAALAFEKRDQAEDQPEADTEAQPDAEAQSDDPDAEAEQADTDEDTDAELEEVELEGFKLAVPKEQAEALKKATLRQADYSRKMNEVSAKEKQAQAQLQTAELLVSNVEKVAEVKAAIRMLDQQIKQYEAVDWQRLRAEDPATYSMHATDLQNLRLSRAQAEQAAKGVEGELAQARHQEFAEKRTAMSRELQKTFGDWNKASDEICAYAEAAGVKLETLSTITDPALVVALDKARKFDALQKAKTTLKAKVQDAPRVIKPGAPRKAPDQSADAMARLRKSNTLDDATAAFLSRMK